MLKFVDLIDLLAKHRLYISDSGLIAKYGKTKGTEVTLNSKRGTGAKIVEFFTSRLTSLSWFGLFLILNIVLFVAGVFSNERSGWNQWAYGTGPALSMNCVLVLLPTLHSFVHLMRANSWLNKVRQIYLAEYVWFTVILVLIFAADPTTDQYRDFPPYYHGGNRFLDPGPPLDPLLLVCT